MHKADQHDIPTSATHPPLGPGSSAGLATGVYISPLHMHCCDIDNLAKVSAPWVTKSACCRFNALDLATGAHKTGSPTAPLAATRTFPNGPLPNNATTFVAIKQLQRPGAATEGLRPLIPRRRHAAKQAVQPSQLRDGRPSEPEQCR